MRAAHERHLGARDRAHAEVLRCMGELERAVDAVVVGERERVVAELGRARRKLLRQRRAVEERVRRVRMQLDVGGAPFGLLLGPRRQRCTVVPHAAARREGVARGEAHGRAGVTRAG